jgi:hypothetical protein
MAIFDDDNVMRRSLAAYFRSASSLGILMQPSQGDSGVQNHAGLSYAVLRNGGGILAVYRITNAGQLKRLKRWPKALEIC